MNTWTNEERKKLYNYISKQYNINYNDVVFVVEEGEKHLLTLGNKYEDFEENLRLSQEYQEILIEFCKTKNWSNNNPYL